MTTTRAGQTGHMMRLPVWVTGILLVAGLVPGMFALESSLKFVWIGLLLVNVVGMYKDFGGEVSRLEAAYVGRGPVDRRALLKSALQSQATSMWLVLTLALGATWTIILVTRLVGFAVGLSLLLALFALIFGGAAIGYQTAKTKGYFNN